MARMERTGVGRSISGPPGFTAAEVARARARFGTFDALAVRDFRYLWTGMIISNVGSWMQMIGQGWLVLQLTNSPFWLGLVAFARAIPVLALSLVAGVLADRVDRRRLLLVTQSVAGVMALLLAVLTSLGAIQVWQIIAIAFVSAGAMAFDNPARQALVPDMVGKELLMNAVGLNSAAWNGAAVLGPSLAGGAIGVIGVAGCFYLNAISYLAVIWAIWAMGTYATGARRGTLWENLAEGLRFIRRHRAVLAIFVLVATPSLLGRPYQQLMPVFARDVLGGGPRTYGALMSASGAGALVGALLTASLGTFRHKGWLLLGSCAAFGLVLIAFARSTWLPLSLVMLVLAGGGSTLYMGAANTLLQTGVPGEFRGRIMSVYSLTLGGFMPLGGMLLGSAASLTGSVALVVALGGALVAGTALAVGLTVPEVSNER